MTKMLVDWYQDGRGKQSYLSDESGRGIGFWATKGTSPQLLTRTFLDVSASALV